MSKTGKRGRKKRSEFIDDDRIIEDVQIPPQTSQDKNDSNNSDDDEEEDISAPISMNGEQLKTQFASTSSEVTQIMSKQKAITEETLSVSTTVSENASSIPSVETAATATTTTTTRFA